MWSLVMSVSGAATAVSAFFTGIAVYADISVAASVGSIAVTATLAGTAIYALYREIKASREIMRKHASNSTKQ